MTAQELKNSILQHAVQGKLVPQDPSDEPAVVLLERIKAEKQQLIKYKKIKAEKPLAPIAEEEIPFEIPESWVWVRLGDVIVQNIGGGTPSKSISKYWNGNIPWASVKDLNCEELNSTIDTITEDGLQNSSSNLILSGNIIVCTRMGLGKIVINKMDVAINQDLRGLIIPKFIHKNYFVNFYKTISLIGSGLTVKGIKVEDLNNTLFPLPPLAEQQRIVAKIEELMPLVEEYDKAEKELTDLNAKFPEQIKKSVLQYAIQGKLVAQSKADEPASELLKRIKVEKQQLIKDKKIKAEKPLAPITEEEIPFEIPESWVWVRLGEICKKLTDGTHYTPKYTDNGIPFLSVKDMSSGKLDFRNTRYISPEEHKVLYSRCNPERGDLLLTKVGTTGIPIIVDTDIEFSLFVSVALIKFNNKLIYDKYLVHLINSPLVKIQCGIATKGVGNPNWVMRDIANTIIPLPPLAEQQRIVEKVEEVLGVCEGLK